MTRLYVDEDALNRLLDQAENDARLRSLVAQVRASVRTPPPPRKKKEAELPTFTVLSVTPETTIVAVEEEEKTNPED